MHMYKRNKRKAYHYLYTKHSAPPPSRTEQCPQCDQWLEESERKNAKSSVKCKINYLTMFRLNDQRLLNLIKQARNWRTFFWLSSCFSSARPSMCFLTSATIVSVVFFLMRTLQNHFRINSP
jgi:hypothetical protein